MTISTPLSISCSQLIASAEKWVLCYEPKGIELQTSASCVCRYNWPSVSYYRVLALWLTGILQIQIDLTPVDTNPTAVLVALVMSLLAALLLYEW